MATRHIPRSPMGTHTHFGDDYGAYFDTPAPQTEPSGSVSGHHGSVGPHSRQSTVVPYSRATHSRATSRSRATATPTHFDLPDDDNVPVRTRAVTPSGDLGDDWSSHVHEHSLPPTPSPPPLQGLPEDFTARPNPAVGIPGGPIVQRDLDELEAMTVLAMSDYDASRLVCVTTQQGPNLTCLPTAAGVVSQQPPSTPGMFGPIRHTRASEGHNRVWADTARLYGGERFSAQRKHAFFTATGWELVQVPRYDGLSSYRQYEYHRRSRDVPQWIFIAPTTHQVFALGAMTHSLTSGYVDLLDEWHKASTTRKAGTMVLMNPKSGHARASYLSGRPRSAGAFWPSPTDSRTLREDQANTLEIVLRIAKIVLRHDIPWGIASDGWRHFVVQGPAAEGNVSISRSWGWEEEEKRLEPLEFLTELADEMFATMAEQFVNYAYP
ncbi:uncharacterized protein LOC62_01G000114 [Vanrija pseudolonga]|uniref:Uncharacterized protein n=1 Tax=Vanrija pseudolonga TaxID=143232 RepID=A0AAF0XZ64_9TREE|nr:hypothetical protein LOC62_01G000114 [Vanrija pseudolonga]